MISIGHVQYQKGVTMMMKTQGTSLLTVAQAEAMTGRKASTWRRDILMRRIDYVKIGRQVRIPVDVIEDLIKKGFRPAIDQIS
jgi:hypothetical protein